MDGTIKIAREWRGMKQVELASKAGVSQSYIADWEIGRRRPRQDNVEALAMALDVDAAWIAGHPAALPVRDQTTGEVLRLPIMRSEDIANYGTLYHVWLDTRLMRVALAVIVGDGLTLVPSDWDGQMPRHADEIAGTCWVAPDGSECVMLNGLPRAGWHIG